MQADLHALTFIPMPQLTQLVYCNDYQNDSPKCMHEIELCRLHAYDVHVSFIISHIPNSKLIDKITFEV